MGANRVILDQQTLRTWQQRYEEVRSQQWPRMQRLYHAKAYGPTRFSGPTIIVLDRHTRSTDPALFTFVESYTVAAARADNTEFSRLAAYVGGPIYDERKAGKVQLSIGRRVFFLLQNGCTIFIAPFNDIHNAKLNSRVLELVFNFEVAGKVGEVNYMPATVRYSGAHPLFYFAANLRMFPSYRPLPWITRAEAFISDSPVKLAQLPPEKRNIDGVVSTLFERAEALPEYYHSR